MGRKMKGAIVKRRIGFYLLICSLIVWVQPAFSHCEIPCGIYNDEARIERIEEHITTIEKSMNMIIELSKEKDKNYNQIVRWVNNKETHANLLQHIISQYFMTQRIKIGNEQNKGAYAKYAGELILLHKMLVYAMKAKQSTDLAVVEELRVLLSRFKASYFGLETKEHKGSH